MFGKKKKHGNKQHGIILGMILLREEHSFDPVAFKKGIKANYRITIKEQSGNDGAFACKMDGELVVIGHMPVPVPHGDIENAAKYAYNWETAAEDLKTHKSHLIVTIANGAQDQIKRFKIFTQVMSMLLELTNSLGVYQGTQSLLISKEDYLDQASLMTDDYLPLHLWIYFGYRVTDKGNSIYTYGLKAFDRNEMEIIDSAKSITEITDFMFNMTHYVLEYDVVFEDGQTCGMSAEERIAIFLLKGELVAGNTLKLAY